MFGDQINLRTFYTEEDTWFGNIDYSLPVGSSGLRANISHIHTDYEIGESFAALDAYGMARITQLGLSVFFTWEIHNILTAYSFGAPINWFFPDTMC